MHVIHVAAESHVDNSISSPSEYITNNIVGTHNLLEICRNTWKDNSNSFHHISTDEVFGSLGDEGFYSEQLPMPKIHHIVPVKHRAIRLYVAIEKTIA